MPSHSVKFTGGRRVVQFDPDNTTLHLWGVPDIVPPHIHELINLGKELGIKAQPALHGLFWPGGRVKILHAWMLVDAFMAEYIRSRKQGDTDEIFNIVLPCPGS